MDGPLAAAQLGTAGAACVTGCAPRGSRVCQVRPLRGSIAAPFPKVYAMPFHYVNPVSRRVPPVLLP